MSIIPQFFKQLEQKSMALKIGYQMRKINKADFLRTIKLIKL